jgi:hypothetical protein
MQPNVAPRVLALLLSLSSLAIGCSDSGAGPIDAAAPDALIDADFGWDPGQWSSIKVYKTWLDFGTVDVGASSTAQTVDVYVMGGPVTLNATITGPAFALTGNTCTGSLSNRSCTLSVRFTPATLGAATGALSVSAVGNVPGSAGIALSGIGQAMGSAFPPFADDVALGTLLVNQEAPAVVRLAPTRPVATLACTSSSPDLTLVSQTCPTTGNIDAPCTFTFTFKAATVGTKKDVVICAGGGLTVPRYVVATVVAPEPPAISPATASFTATIGQTDVVTFTVTKGGSAPAGPITATLAGASAFTIASDGCAIPLAPLATCKIQVAFSPGSVGDEPAVLTVTDSGQPTASASASLSGTGVTSDPLRLTPSIVDFGSVMSDTASDARTLTLRNSGSSAIEALTITSSNPAFVIDVQACPPIAPGAACTFAVTLKPTIAGIQQAIISLTTAEGILLATAKVTGVGLAHTTPPPLVTSPPTLDFGTVTVGTRSAPQVFTVVNGGDETTGPLSVQKTDGLAGGASEFATTTTCAAGLPPGATCTVSVTFQPTATGRASAAITVTDGTRATNGTAVGIAVATGVATFYCGGPLPSSATFAATPVGQTSAEIVCSTFDGDTLDAGTLDAATIDGGPLDAGALDGGPTDAGTLSITATATGDFAVTSQACTQTQCSVRLVFKPTAQGARAGGLSVVLTQGSVFSRATVMLAGTGL